MGDRTAQKNVSIQAFFLPTPAPSSSPTNIGDGFTADEVRDALKPRSPRPWHPSVEYAECEIRDLHPGPRAVTFMGRVANIFDTYNNPKTPRSAKGCAKLCVKDDSAAITVRLWYASPPPNIRLGSLVSIWTNHVSNGENGNLSSTTAPLFVSLFPERDRSCHLMLHENSDDGSICRRPLGYREGRPLSGVMTLQNFINGGHEVIDAKVVVVVKSIGAKKKVPGKNERSVENTNLRIEDDTAQSTLGLWGTCAHSPLAVKSHLNSAATNPDAPTAKEPWKAGETVLLIQAPRCKVGKNTYLSTNAATIIDVDPAIPDAHWLRRWSIRQRTRQAINPPFPVDIFDLHALISGPVRCLYTLAELDEFARAAPNDTFQGYLSLVISGVQLVDQAKRGTLFAGECCNAPVYANALQAACARCEQATPLRLNPRILGQVVDETAAIAPGKLLFSDIAWRELLGREPESLLRMNPQQLRYLSDRLLFCRVSVLFGWTGDETKAGGRICVLGVRS